jgi:hypothetical protein
MFVLSSVLLLSVPAQAVQYDIWETGMSQAEIIAVAALNDIPLKIAGRASTSKGFNPKHINSAFYKATTLDYETTTLERETTVVLKMTKEEPKKLYEIEVRIHEVTGDPKFENELIEIMTNKYGPPATTTFKPEHKTIAWRQGGSSHILYKWLSQPVVVYRDMKMKRLAALERKPTEIVRINGFSLIDISKF